MDEATPALYRAFLLLVYSNLWVATAIASLVPFVQLTLGLALDWRPVALIFASALVPYLLDRVVDVYVQEIPDQRAQAFFKQPTSLLLLTLAAMVTAGLIYVAPAAVQWVSLGGLVPLLYGLPLFPGSNRDKLRWYRLKDIPGSKAWIVCCVITYALVAVPMAYAGR
ncbi:MAG: prenyltransferase, partial [Cyanobacteria bacterium P01_A01_bin.135]